MVNIMTMGMMLMIRMMLMMKKKMMMMMKMSGCYLDSQVKSFWCKPSQ